MTEVYRKMFILHIHICHRYLHRLTYIEEMYGNNCQIQESGVDYMAKVYVKSVYLETFISTMQERETYLIRENIGETIWHQNILGDTII